MTTTAKEIGTHPDPAKVWMKGLPIISTLEFTSCPIEAGLSVLGKKWAMQILRDMAMRKVERFSGFMKTIPGITPRVLSIRLRGLEQAGMISKVENRKESSKFVRWNLTEKGWDTLPILMSYVAFGSKWFAPFVFTDSKPREMNELYPQSNLREMFVNIDVDRKRVRRILAEEQECHPQNQTWK